MKTVQIQLAITALKGTIRDAFGDDPISEQAWTDVCEGINNIVKATHETMPKTVIKEVEVIREVIVERQVPVEVVREVVVERVVEKAIEVPTEVFVPIYEPKE